jgi:alpha-D-ribose 1-methylphosphonate 5-triphosphate synthase subunit PhnG
MLIGVIFNVFVIEISFRYGEIVAMDTQHIASTRAEWISLLAKAPVDLLSEVIAAYGEMPPYEWLRRPEIGLAMVRARIGGTGAKFNLGEMTVTRCTLRLHTGQMGVAYVAGRHVRHAEWAAVFDALMQTQARDHVIRTVLCPIKCALDKNLVETQARVQATKVDFNTMVRGEST